MLDDPPQVVIRRAGHPDAPPDGVETAFGLLADGARQGLAGVLVTITGIEGGAPRPVGTHMAVLADGRYSGYVSGGCVEAAVAAEALAVLAKGEDQTIRFGVNSPFLDIKLPCGGGIDLHFHIVADTGLGAKAIKLLEARQPFALHLGKPSRASRLVEDTDDVSLSGWHGQTFVRHYAPVTRLVLAGRGIELEELSRIACASRLEVHAFSPDRDILELAGQFGAKTQRLTAPDQVPELPVDQWSAAIMLFHDHDWERALLRQFVQSPAFFIGAMGSRNTHATRKAQLVADGVPDALVARINGPIGLFGPTRDAASLSLSVLAQVAQARMTYDMQ